MYENHYLYENHYPYENPYLYEYTDTDNQYDGYSEYRIDYSQYVGRIINARATVPGYFSRGTQIFIHRTFTRAGRQMVVVVYPTQSPYGCTIKMDTFRASVLDGQITRRTLRRGDQGSDVIVLQQALNRAGFYFGRIDGIFGPVTEKAVRGFQRSRGLVVDGIVGRRTWGALEEFIS
ncbi:peptidoglycan-binding domain-containing protein [Bacillus chungangensis]|uniref:Peptidoglycan binding-like domain-containing protein n=1 Tax=Bacillus chungangensis TaxID=587633 RepID=A0ABT9WQQ2_9BACI|nr:peptidoglycan-binding domain-containing protein [Bacillus chungangensis]MDQ0175110.1 hypothetical protein [Bacillus chungangensis]